MGFLKRIRGSEKPCVPAEKKAETPKEKIEQEFPGWEISITGNAIDKYEGAIYHNKRFRQYAKQLSPYRSRFNTVEEVLAAARKNIEKEIKRIETTVEKTIKL